MAGESEQSPVTKGAPPVAAAVPEVAARTVAWLLEKWTGPKTCPICQAEKWSAGPWTSELPGRVEWGGGGRAFPVVVVTCMNCGYELLFNALVMGLRSPPSGEAS